MVASVFVCVLIMIFTSNDVLGDDVDAKETSSLREKVDQLERVLTGMNALLYRQETEMSQLKVAIRDQKELIRQQSKKALQQESEIFRLQESVLVLQAAQKTYLPEQNIGQLSGNLKLKPRRKRMGVAQDKTSMSTPDKYHDVMTRSDDLGPLEAVVSQISNRVTEMSADLQTLKNSNVQRDHSIQNAHTSTFIHWGSSQCSSDSQLVYSGVMGGSEYHQTGAATNYLCLTMNPVPSSHGLPAAYATVYGTEYETGGSHQNRDAVCAVCRSSQPTTIMIPGTNACSAGWQRQYSGYLMAGHPKHVAGTEFICVDSSLEGRPGTSEDHNGKLLYYAVTKCGSLPCDPYADNKIVTCVVCSQ